MSRPIFDAHLDLAWSAVFFNRDLTARLEEVRRPEKGMTDERSRGRNTVTLPELHKANVRVCVATLLARGGPDQPWRPGFKRSDLDWANPTHAYASAQGQLAYYRALEQQGHLRMIRTGSELSAHWEQPGKDATPALSSSNGPALSSSNGPMGFVLSMEGADPILTPAQVREWWDAGLRAIGPAHYGRGQYAYGTGVRGPLGPAGRELLREMEKVGMILDVTHLCDECMEEALGLFGGPVLASHHNCRALVPGDRQLTDAQIRQLAGRGAVIGAALDAWMLYPDWVRGQTQPEVVGLEAVADHIDHVCQLAGDATHAGIGSDLDGGFGNEQTPGDLNTIADLQKLAPILAHRGFADSEIELIFHGNWLRFFRGALPQAVLP